ncbi:MAG: diguanylate cyclase [Actinobacteria bacterium]|nr:diguanylate cyclase [Actinomycetota bacterium]
MATQEELSTDEARIAELKSQIDELRLENGTLRLQLDVLSSTDIVTGLPNTNGILQTLDSVVARHNRAGEAFGVMLVRVPAIATIGEHHGRAGVNDALRHAGALIAAGLRRLDMVGRLDDSAFLAVLPMLDEAGCDTVVTRLSKLLASVPMTFERDRLEMKPQITIALSAPGVDLGSQIIVGRVLEKSDEPGDDGVQIFTLSA